MRVFNLLYNSFIWAMACAVALFQNTWLEMRVNVGGLFFLLWLLFFMGLRLWGKDPGKKTTAASVVCVFADGAAVLGLERMSVLPALILREGLGVSGLHLSVLNAALGGFLVIGFIIVLLFRRNES